MRHAASPLLCARVRARVMPPAVTYAISIHYCLRADADTPLMLEARLSAATLQRYAATLRHAMPCRCFHCYATRAIC